MYGMATIVNTILYICILYIWNLLRVNLKVFITEKSYNYVCWWILTKHRDHLIAYGNGGLVAKSWPTPVTPWTVTHQAPLSMGSSRQEYWSGFPFSSPGDLPDPGIEPRSPILQADYLPPELQGKPLTAYTCTKSLSMHQIPETVVCHILVKKKIAATQMDIEIIILSEVSHTEKDKYHMTSLICGI